jgi:HSP20 family protein
MFGLTRWNLDDIFAFQHEIDRVLNHAWKELPRRQAMEPAFQVRSGKDEWHVEVPLPGIDPQHVSLETAGNALSIRVHEPDQPTPRYEQTFTVPQFLDIERLTASHRHGMLRLALPIRESLKPRRIAIDAAGSDQKQLAAA